MPKAKLSKVTLSNGHKDNHKASQEANGDHLNGDNGIADVLEPRPQKLHLGFADYSQSQPAVAQNGNWLGSQELSQSQDAAARPAASKTEKPEEHRIDNA